MKPLGDGFIKLIRMMIAPIIFLTVVVGIANIGDMGKLGRLRLKALLYFEVLTTAALVIGLVVVTISSLAQGSTPTLPHSTPIPSDNAAADEVADLRLC
jgi:aerobic C4-dicarboxylate transport protein